MTALLRFFSIVVLAIAAGGMAGEVLSRTSVVRDFLGRVAGRGHLVTITNGKGIYETDLDPDDGIDQVDIVIQENLAYLAKSEFVSSERIDREVGLLAAQFPDEHAFDDAIKADGRTISSLREQIARHLRAMAWLEKRAGSGVPTDDTQARQFFDTHPNFFARPVRYRVSHVFLAAHADTPIETVQEKEAGISVLAARIKQGESLSEIALQASEDELTKPRGGDLGFFSGQRMPADFVSEIGRLRVGETSKPFRTYLGFHIAQVTARKDAESVSFEEARPAIQQLLANETRASAVNQVAIKLSGANVVFGD